MRGINSVRHYVWRGKLPYRMAFDVRATRIEDMVAIEGTARGDLSGIGRWNFSHKDDVTIVRYEWRVRSRRWWMNLVAPVARSIFVRNHAQIMEQGGKKLAQLLKARLLGQETIDLAAESPARKVARERSHGRDGIGPAPVKPETSSAGTR